MPRNIPCDHRACAGDPCRMLTDAELEPAGGDFLRARSLIADGFLQTSAKHRRLARLKPSFPTTAQMIRPEMLNTGMQHIPVSLSPKSKELVRKIRESFFARLGETPMSEIDYAELEERTMAFALSLEVGGMYVHHRTREPYTVTALATREHDLVPVVVYQGRDEKIWTRPVSEWSEIVDGFAPRFVRVS